jgi:hypothetical protein
LQTGTAGDPPLNSPIIVFASYRINVSRLTAPSFPARDRSLVTAFRSPATAATFAATIPGSKLPACYFASRLAVSTARSVFRLCRRNSVRPDSGRFNASNPLRFLPARLGWLLLPPPLPVRTFTLPRDQSVQQGSQPASPPFRLRPISYRSPQPLSITRLSSYGSTFQARYVSGGLLFRSATISLGSALTTIPPPKGWNGGSGG